jgi:hypothetical protein
MITPNEYIAYSHSIQQALNEMHELFWVNEDAAMEKVSEILKRNIMERFEEKRANEILGLKHED